MILKRAIRAATFALLLTGCGGGASGMSLDATDSRLHVAVVVIGPVSRDTVSKAIPIMVEKYARVGIEVAPEFFYFDGPAADPFPEPYDPYYFKLRQIIGTRGAMLVITNTGVVNDYIPATAKIDGLATPGCCQGYCHAWMTTYVGDPEGEADLMAYELSHLLGTPGVLGNQEGDEKTFAGRDMSAEIQNANNGGMDTVCR